MGGKPSHTVTGRAGEDAAARFLMDSGYRIVDRNNRCRLGEIDLIAREGACVVFIEVKTRTGPGFGAPAEAVTPRKQQQLVRLAARFLAERGWSNQPCRFDVVAVEPAAGGGWSCTLIKDAFGVS